MNDFKQLFVYIFISLEIVTLALWLIFGMRLQRWAGFISGILFTGALFAFLLGILLLPFSLIGLIVIIGILGFTPFFTFFVFRRNGMRAFHKAKEQMSRTWLTGTLLLGIFFGLAVPSGLQWYTFEIISTSIEAAIHGDFQAADSEIQKIRLMPWCFEGCLNEMIWIYNNTENPEHKEAIARIYQEITGEDLEEKLAILLD